jgi:hypothetical protein
VGCCLLAVGCGSSSSTTTTSSSTTAGGSPTGVSDAVQAARVKASVCLRAHGIDVPDLTPGGGRLAQALRVIAGYPPAKIQAAEQSCASEIKQAFPNLANVTPAQQAQRRREATVFAQCMRAHGINFPDPSTALSDPSAYLKAVTSINTSSPAYKAVAPGCRTEALKAGG